MKITHRILALVCLATPVLAAQEEQLQPAEELAAFETMLGHWEGRGTVVMAPGTDGLPWTATIDVRRILDGHAVQEQVTVNLGEGMPPMEMQSIYAFESESGELINFGVGSMGGNAGGNCKWLDRGTLISTGSGYEDGQWFTDRATSKFTQDTWTFDIQRMLATGPAFEHLAGTFKKTAREGAAKEASARADKLAEPLARLEPLIGKWKLEGSMIPMPGMERVPISGSETYRPVYEGQAVEVRVRGDKAPGSDFEYKALGFLFMDEHAGCYQFGYVSNMGDAGAAETRWTDDGALVTTHAGTSMGAPMVERSMAKMTDDGGMHVTMDRMLGSGKSERTFEARYTRVAKDE
jgi:hypothetical protein